MLWTNDLKLFDYVKPIKEVSENDYYEMLGCLPPVAMVSNAFLVGEPTDHQNGLPRYALYFIRDKKYFYGGLTSEPDFKSVLIPVK